MVKPTLGKKISSGPCRQTLIVVVLIIVGLGCLAADRAWGDSSTATSLGSTATSLLGGSSSSILSQDNQVGNKTLAASASARAATELSETTIATTTRARKDFLTIGQATKTDKVRGHYLEQKNAIHDKLAVRPRCRFAGHFYHTLYNKWLGPYANGGDGDDNNNNKYNKPFQFLEIGFYNGKGFDAYKAFLPSTVEFHSMEISCIEPGPRNQGKWPWGNFAAKNLRYQEYLDTRQLHCGDASDYGFLHQTYTQQMKRPGAPPLRVVIDDASHLASHMTISLFFWFPRLAPGGLLIVEDIQPTSVAEGFRTHVVTQVMRDLHYCGDVSKFKERACFPTIWPLLHSVHCEMHICVFERNQEPAVEYNETLSMPPKHALDARQCLFNEWKA